MENNEIKIFSNILKLFLNILYAFFEYSLVFLQWPVCGILIIKYSVFLTITHYTYLCMKNVIICMQHDVPLAAFIIVSVDVLGLRIRDGLILLLYHSLYTLRSVELELGDEFERLSRYKIYFSGTKKMYC